MDGAPTRAERLAALLRRALDGQARLPSERDLADRHQVSRATVRTALQILADQGLIARAQRRRASALGGGHAPGPVHLLYVSPHASEAEADPFLGGLALRLAEADPRHPLRVVLATPGEDPLDRLESQAAWSDLRAGVVLAGVAVPRRRLQRRLAEAGVPLVLLGEAGPAEGIPWVQADQAGCGRQAVQHLAGHGRRRLALIDGPWSHPPARQMREGFLAAAGELGLEAVAHEALCWDIASGHRAALALTAGSHPPDGLVLSGDLATSGVLAALRERGLAVPAAVAVVAVGLPLRAAQLIGATAFVGDLAGHARAALDLLAHPRPGPVLVPNRLLPGTTCGCPRPRR